ncbi:MAG: hypothetical protein ACMXYG_02595 [Candidatus Woesearchaeota archaeon]
MVLHHSFAEKNFKSQCIYCGTDFSDLSWNTLHEGLKVYKELCCCPTCNRQITIALDFHTSGHDGWDGKHSWLSNTNVKISTIGHKVTNLESKIKILSESMYP